MNITCDYRLENSVLVHQNGFVFSYYSFSVYRFKSIPSKSSLSFLVTPVPQILNINQNSKTLPSYLSSRTRDMDCVTVTLKLQIG